MSTDQFPNPIWKNKSWYSFNDYMSARFGEKVYKVTVSAGFTCPTRDGTRGSDGCSFCDERGSSSFFSSGSAALSIRKQLEASIPKIEKRFNAHKFLAYFQSFTNTYGPLPYLREVYDGAMNVPGVIGMAIGTRPDCIPNEVLSLVHSYANPGKFVSLELGVQSFRDEALNFYDRGHSAAEAIDGIKRALKYPNLNIAVHLIFGAPRDTVEDAISSAKLLSELGVHGVKIHQLMVLKNTTLAKRYAIQPWSALSMEEYNEMACAFLENLDPKIHVERTHALSSHPEELVIPQWSAERFNPQNHLRKKMESENRFHGSEVQNSLATFSA